MATLPKIVLSATAMRLIAEAKSRVSSGAQVRTGAYAEGRAAGIAEERERCAKLVPTNWCDNLLSGKDAPKLPMDGHGVETLLRGIRDRIRNPTG